MEPIKSNATTPLNDQTILQALPDHLTCDLAGEAAILKISDGIYYGLNETAAFLWERMQQPISLADLRNELTNEFNVSEKQASDDLTTLLKEMLQAKLIKTDDLLSA